MRELVDDPAIAQRTLERALVEAQQRVPQGTGSDRTRGRNWDGREPGKANRSRSCGNGRNLEGAHLEAAGAARVVAEQAAVRGPNADALGGNVGTRKGTGGKPRAKLAGSQASASSPPVPSGRGPCRSLRFRPGLRDWKPGGGPGERPEGRPEPGKAGGSLGEAGRPRGRAAARATFPTHGSVTVRAPFGEDDGHRVASD
eukprot:gene3769-biopygen8257